MLAIYSASHNATQKDYIYIQLGRREVVCVEAGLYSGFQITEPTMTMDSVLCHNQTNKESPFTTKPRIRIMGSPLRTLNSTHAARHSTISMTLNLGL